MKKKLLKLSVVGKTNAGKSTFVNKVIGETITIHNKKINTTRELIVGVKNLDEVQLLFYDTPGSNVIKSANIKQKQYKKNLWQGIDQSNIILFFIDSKVSILFKVIFDPISLKKLI